MLIGLKIMDNQLIKINWNENGDRQFFILIEKVKSVFLPT